MNFSPELGQFVFGNRWEKIETPEFVIHGLTLLGGAIEAMRGVNPMDNSGSSFVNDVFEARSYYWGDDKKLGGLPNFKCEDLEVFWYKYQGRGSSMNKEITREDFHGLLVKCFRSLLEEGK